MFSISSTIPIFSCLVSTASKQVWEETALGFAWYFSELRDIVLYNCWPWVCFLLETMFSKVAEKENNHGHKKIRNKDCFFQKRSDQTSLLLLLLLLLNRFFHSTDYFSISGWFLFHMIFWRLYSFLFSFIFVDYVFGVTLEKLEKTHCQEECWGNLLSHTYSWLTSSAFAYFFLCSLPVFSFHSFKKHFIFVFCKMQEFMFF